MARHPLTWLDVFTARPLTGNQLAVVHDADRLEDATMLAFARETGLSETTFVQSATEPAADYRNRIWMTRGELRFAGHPSIGTAVAVAVARGESSASYLQQTPAGLQRCDVERGGERRARCSMLQEPAETGPLLDAEEVLQAVGLTEADADPELPPQVVGTGVPQLLVPVAEAALARARPEHAEVRRLIDGHAAVVLYLAACDVARGRARARAFYPEPGGGGSEDPATGSAAGPLLAYLHDRAGLERLTVAQGLEMGRPSELVCSVERGRIRVGGDVVVVATGTVAL